MVEYDFVKSGLSKNLLPDNTPYNPTYEDRKHLDSVIDVFLKTYKEIKLKEYFFQYSFTKNKFNDIEVWILACRRDPFFIKDPVEVYRGFSGDKMTYYILVNITQQRAYFYRDFDPANPLESYNIKGYFYLKAETKEVKNSIEFIYEPAIWRNFDFNDWGNIK
jgi:hypothetical protein